MFRLSLLLSIFMTIKGCSSNVVSIEERNQLIKFSYASCLSNYFKSEGINRDDIKAVSAGMVEKSEISIEKFRDLAVAIRDFNPNHQSKNNINIQLLKCFYLDDSQTINEIIGH